MTRHQQQSGFTAVELLITLFVAAAFLIAGYQLFNVVIRDGGQTRSESRAGNIAYDYLRRYTPSATNPCTVQHPLHELPLSIDGLTNTTISVDISCPEYSTTGISKIETTIGYNVPPQTLKYSTYVNGAGTQTTDITDGLIDWWKFNGNANSSVGTASATANTATLTTGQGGMPNTAYNFNGTNGYMTVPTTNLPATITAITVTVWTKSPTITNGVLINTGASTSSDINIHLPYGDNYVYWDFGNGTAGNGRLSTAFTNPGWLNTWNFWSFVAGGSEGMKIYRNGVLLNSSSNYAAGGFSRGSTTTMAIGGTPASFYWNGDMDDLRIYGRTLSASEISTLYGGGAK